MSGRSAPTDIIPVSVVVCARNRDNVIGRCLEAISRAGPAEVIVIDGDSSDQTVPIARRYGATVMSDGAMGLGAARQLGAEHARSEFIVYVDTDTVITPTTLADLYEEATGHLYDGLQARLATLSPNPSYWQWAEGRRRLANEIPGPSAAIGCQATLLRRRVVLETGFDPVFRGAAEDGDFCFRAAARGARWGHATRAQAYHEDRATLVEFVRQRVWHGRGLARQIIRHHRVYSRGARSQAAGARGNIALDRRLIPFFVVSTLSLAVGLSVECLNLALRPNVLHTVRHPRLPN